MATILVVDPRPHFRNALADALRNWFTVHTAYDEPGALAAISCFSPQAVLCSLVQRDEQSGLDVCRRGRRLDGGKGCAMIVYGLSGSSAPNAERKAMLERRSKVDLFLAERLSPEEVTGRLLGVLLRLDAVASGVGKVDARLEPLRAAGANDGVLSARRDPTLADVSWGDLLRRDVDGGVMKEVLRRGVTSADVSRYDSTAEIPWNELLRAPARPKNVRRLFSKALKTGS